MYGGLGTTWEWDPSNAIRSPLYPLLYAVYFKVVSLLNIDYTLFITYGPNLINACLLWVSDMYFYESVKTVYNARLAKFSFIVYLIAQYPLLMLTRTLSNTFEAMLLIVCVYYYVNMNLHSNCLKMLTCLITISFIIRNTSVIPWIVPILWMIISKKLSKEFFLSGLIVALPLILFSITVDSIYYGKFTIVAYNFYEFNVGEGKSVTYGSLPFHTYVSDFILYEWNVMYPVLIIGIVMNIRYHLTIKTFPVFM